MLRVTFPKTRPGGRNCYVVTACVTVCYDFCYDLDRTYPSCLSLMLRCYGSDGDGGRPGGGGRELDFGLWHLASRPASSSEFDQIRVNSIPFPSLASSVCQPWSPAVNRSQPRIVIACPFFVQPTSNPFQPNRVLSNPK